MSYEIPTEKLTLIAGADLSAKKYYAVKINSDGHIVLAGSGENAVGILQDKPASGYAGAVMTLGVTLAMYGGDVTAGQNLTPDAAGKLVTAGVSDAVIAVALESGADTDIKSVLLITRTSSGANTNSVVAIPIKLSKVADGDVLTNWTPGFGGTIVKVAFAVTDPVTTADKGAALNLEINAVNVTGGGITLTSANCTPLGAVINGAAITGNNTFGAADTISVEASATTAFIEGEGVLLITLG